MKGQEIGYIRVSSIAQNTARQLDGIQLDKIFEDHCSGKDATSRPQLQECLRYLREGDVLHVHSIDRLARNLGDLQAIISNLTSKGVCIKFHKENLSFDSGSENPMDKLLLQMLGAFAEFERTIIRERQREGIAKAKAEGKYHGRRSRLSPNDIDDMMNRKREGMSMTAIGKLYGMTRQGVYKALNRSMPASKD